MKRDSRSVNTKLEEKTKKYSNKIEKNTILYKKTKRKHEFMNFLLQEQHTQKKRTKNRINLKARSITKEILKKKSNKKNERTIKEKEE